MKDKLATWRCPKCQHEIQALLGANAVSHRCPSNKNLPTQWELVEEKEK